MKFFLKFLFVALLLGIAGVAYYIYNQKNSKKDISLDIEYPTHSDIIQTITATGRLQPIDQVDVGTEVSGTVSRIYTDFNQQVKKGQVLLQIDPLRARARVEQTRASYRIAENELRFQRRNYERTKELFNRGSVAATELETAEYRYRNSQNSLINARSNLEQAELDLANCTIKSPIDGIVLSRAVEAGQTVAASLSAPTLFILARDLTQMEVKADVDEADIGQVKKGQRVEFSVDAFPGDKFAGEVQEVRLSPNISSNVVTYTVIIKSENPEQKLLPGMTANCNIIVKEAVQALTIPARALQFRPNESTPGYNPRLLVEATPGEKRGGGQGVQGQKQRRPEGGRQGRENRGRVWTVARDGFLRTQNVELGISDGARVEVVSGLELNTPVAIGVTSTANTANRGGAQTNNPFMPQQRKAGQGGGMRTR
ncbi:MAG: efflux RND transporter periplasmic adaptor subunit [Fibromonadaceae bacterium]|jgi:HlyD family secretion protein|nr:efflux RND transporter periplasmic adaptor subunit [Fibromonadaceae bacterium]